MIQLKLLNSMIYVEDIYQTSLYDRMLIIFGALKRTFGSSDAYDLVAVLNTNTSSLIYHHFAIKHRTFNKQKCRV